MICLLALIACRPRPGCAPETLAPPVHAYDLLTPFERPRLEAFSGRQELDRYLDSLCYLQDQSFDGAGPPPTLPKHPPSRERPVWADAQRDHLNWRRVVGVWSYGPMSERPPRLVRVGARVYALRGDQLRSVEIGGGHARLRAGPGLLLNPRPPSEAESSATDAGVSGRPRPIEDDVRGVAVFDYLFAHADELLVVGTRQDRWAIEILRIGIGAHGELRRKSSHLIHFLAREVDGYRARLHEGALVLSFQHKAVYDGSAAARPSAWSLPALEEEGAGGAPRALLQAGDVYRPLGHTDETYLHTLVHCDLRLPGLVCGARALPGPEAHTSYLTADALYLWLVAWRGESREVGSFLVRMPFAPSQPVGALRIPGSTPSHGLSPALHEHANHLFAIVATGEPSSLRLLRAPVSRFDAATAELAPDAYRTITGAQLAKHEARDARLVGRYLVWGEEGHDSGYMMRYGPLAPNVELVSLADGTRASLPLAHTATYVHEFGDDIVVVGTDSWNVHVSVIGVRDRAGKVLAHYVSRDAVRKLDRHGGAPPLHVAGSSRWLAFDITPHAEGDLPHLATRLPLRWAPPSAELAPTRLWTAPYEGTRLEQQEQDEWLDLDDERVLVRMQNQLLLYRMEEEPVLEQRLAL